MRPITNRPTLETQRLVDRLGGSWHGNVAMCRCPAHEDRTPSLSIRQGDRSILVTCFAGCSNDDVLKAIRRLSPIPAADQGTVERSRTKSGNPHWAIWQAARTVRGTLGERYLVEARRLTKPLNNVRFHPQCPRGSGKSATFEPALIVAMHLGNRLTAIQRLFLDPKTALCTAKIVLGQSIGAAWTNGIVSEKIALAEGFETAAAFSQLSGIPAWASMGARRLPQVRFPPEVRTVLLLRDNDIEGEAAEHKAEITYRAQGLRVEHAPPPTHANDWADLL
ncbi:MAG: toprim domain-containing protein [Sphingorhabdus sp.]